MGYARFVVVAIFLISGVSISSSLSGADKLLSQSERPIQEQILRVRDAMVTRIGGPSKEVAAFQEIQNLRNIGADNGEIVKQVAIYSAGPGEEPSLTASWILGKLDFPPGTVIRVLAPYLDAENKNLRAFVRDWFQWHDNAGSPSPDIPPLQPVNYEDYKDYVRGLLNMGNEVPPGFTEYIYERAPGRAMLVFYYASQPRDKDLLLSEHNVSNAVWLKDNGFKEQFQEALPEASAELAELANRKDWWARLYVAYIMLRHPELRQTAVIQGLVKDDNELVSKTAESIK